MSESLYLQFVAMWAIGVTATLVGFFWKRPAASPRVTFGSIVKVGLFTWAFVFIVAICSQTLLSTLGAPADKVQSLGWLLIPLIAGAVFAHLRFAKLRAL